MSQVLVLRPQPGASATLEKARAIGLDAVAIPLFEIEAVAWQPPDAGSFDGLLLTSANAVRLGGEELRSLRGLKVYAVGEATAEAARGAGFDIAASGEAGIDRLLGSIEPDLKLLHLCGADRREPDKASQPITRVTVYRAVPIEAPDLSAAGDGVALIHSPRAARRFAELASDRNTIAIVAISDSAAEAAGKGWRMVETADKSTDEALLALAARLCKKPDPE
jgi:uroporphyrinogen-III synthase